MKKIITLTLSLIITLIANNAIAQHNNYNLFTSNKPAAGFLKQYLQKGEIVHFAKENAALLLNNKNQFVNFIFQFENKEWIIELEKTTVTSTNFFVTTGSSPSDKYNFDNKCLHYKGKIKNSKKSFAAVSIFENRIVAVIADDGGNINIGAINTAEARINNEHIIYREADLLLKNEFACGAISSENNGANPIPTYDTENITATINTEPVDVYFEADYQTFLNNGSNVTNVVNYVTALFNVVKVLYENDSINTNISAIKVWNITDPYNSLTTTSSVLSAFSTNMSNGFPGDLAHFLSQRGLGGGIAYLNVLCSGNGSKVAVSDNLTNSFNTFPTYSWSAMVITHEMGHNLGSPHTQSCSWPGGAIDNCYATEGGCAQGPAPTSGGTIMSYCHLTGYGINFANGFGSLPGAKIRNYVRNNPCINPGVYFETTFQNVTEETADVPIGCLNYKLLTTKIKIPYAPTQPVDVIILPTGNTGLIIGTNKDVEISPLNFTLDANNLSQQINMKVYNDAYVENIETLTLNFNINANAGNAVKRNIYTTDVINITSEDHRPDSTLNQTLFTELFDNIATGLGSWTQNIIYGATSLNRWIVAADGSADFPTKAAYISNNGASLSYAGNSISDSTIVRLESPSINANGFSNMHLTFLCKVTGEYIFVNGGPTGGGVTYLDYGRVLYSIDNGTTWGVARDNIINYTNKYLVDITLPSDANNAASLKIAFEWRNNSSIVKIPPFIIDSIVIKGASTCDIQTAMHPNNSIEEYVGPNQTVHYYNPITKNIMATIENNSNFDFGCTQVELVRTGIGATQAWGVLAADKISNKAYKITTTNTSNNANYSLKLYYINAEINGWLTATGNALADVQIVKTNSDITSAPVASPAIFSSINSKVNFGGTLHSVITSTYSENAPISYYAVMKPYGNADCPINNISYSTIISGTNYQWQANNGVGYVNIINDAVYNNTITNSLQLIAPPANLFGNKYRCEITTPTGLVYSQEFILKFGMTWIGVVSDAWENPLNWSCNMIPNDKTDVIINSGTPFSPQVNSSTSIRSLSTTPSININVKTGATLLINH